MQRTARPGLLVDGSVEVGNTATAPAGTVSAAGGGTLYARNGELWWRGSAGTRTRMAPAQEEREEQMVQLTPDELVAEFQEAVVELYFARKRIVALESENAALKARLSAPVPPPQEAPADIPADPARDAAGGGEQWFSGVPGEPAA
ncbi:hypothetical protein ACGF1Z_30565 [Streptomyces sp. NPDC048018]|uniref:hypothetical protein n=1 Tax=Streptomyces sp. NPDC048018 TaxID=3365499 RepID=UPI0037236151